MPPYFFFFYFTSKISFSYHSTSISVRNDSHYKLHYGLLQLRKPLNNCPFRTTVRGAQAGHLTVRSGPFGAASTPIQPPTCTVVPGNVSQQQSTPRMVCTRIHGHPSPPRGAGKTLQRLSRLMRGRRRIRETDTSHELGDIMGRWHGLGVGGGESEMDGWMDATPKREHREQVSMYTHRAGTESWKVLMESATCRGCSPKLRVGCVWEVGNKSRILKQGTRPLLLPTYSAEMWDVSTRQYFILPLPKE